MSPRVLLVGWFAGSVALFALWVAAIEIGGRIIARRRARAVDAEREALDALERLWLMPSYRRDHAS